MRQMGRRILLEAAAVAGLVRFVSELGAVTLSEDKKTSWVTVTRTGDFSDPRYGKFAITRPMLDQMVKNFGERTYGQDIFIDVAHRPDNGAAAKVLKLAVEGDRLRAQVEWTPMGVEAVKSKGYAYLSAEYHENWRDNEKGEPHGCVLLGAGLVTRPCIKRLDPVQLSEGEGGKGDIRTALHPKLLSDLISDARMTMNKFLEQLKASLEAKGVSAAAVKALCEAYVKAATGMTDEGQMKALCESFEATGKSLVEGTAPVVNVVSGLTAEQVSAQVAKLLGEQATEAKKLAEAGAAKVKLLAETIGEKIKDDAIAKTLTEAVAGVVGGLDDVQIKQLAAVQVAAGEAQIAAKQLSAMGFQFRGNAHITVDSTNNVKALQESVDKRLGIATRKDEPNAAIVEKVLAAFDAERGADLHREHKLLAGGDGVISDVSVPAVFERTVIREALYPLVALQFVNAGTIEFAVAQQIPYSHRDNAGAGRDSTRKYEGQSIARAGIKQALETAYPIPQKLAFEVSDELRYLTAAGRIDFNATSENVANASRIVGEDLERLISNELVNAADEFAVTTATGEVLTSQVQGTNKVFVLANFPVVRPRKIYDLQGAQIGSTVNPITVTLNSVVRSEYDGTGTQASGTYYVMDYNLGEIRFVTELGAAFTPTSAWVLTVTYGYSTNAYKFDTDLGAATVGTKWDDFLYRYGLRKSILEDQRFYRANFGLMSGTVHEQILQANQFAALYDRGAANVTTNGDLGPVRGVPNAKIFAPGLQMGDTRVLIGERGNTRFRMAKPWQMGELQDQRDANGRFTGKKEAYGDQFIFLHSPSQLKGSCTSVILFSTAGRVARVS